MITRTFKLCLNAGTGSAPYINVSQYDEGETWLFELYSETGERYIPTTGAIVGVKSDGHGIANTGTVDSEGRVVIAETQQMTASAGRAIYELSIDGLTHGTANFIVAVERKPTDDAVMSDSDLSLIQEAIDSAEVIVEVIGDSDPSEVIGEHVDDWLDNHPEATTTVEDGAITAPKLNSTLWDKLLVSEEASGAVASFDDGADDVPVSSLKVALEPIQTGSGDPSPSNIRPISGHSSVTVERTGKNLCDWNINVTSSALSISLPAGNYYISASTTISAGSWYIRATDSNGQYSYSSADIGKTGWPKAGSGWSYGGQDEQGIPFTVPNGCKLIEIGKLNANGTIPAMLNSGNTAIEYEPYIGTSYPYTLGQTVYGGSVDLATGVLTVDKWIVDMGTATYSTANALGWSQITSVGAKPFDNSAVADVYCDILVADTANRVYQRAKDNSIGVNNAGRIQFVMSSIANYTSAQIQTALTGHFVVYPLATPQTIQLTPQEVKTLLGYNNISSTGTVEVIYHADTKLYVDKMTAVDNNIIAPTEADFVATRNYTVNDLVIVNDTLYKVTANIANGGTITPNSNVTQTTLGALIKALS